MKRYVFCIKWGTRYGPEYVNKLRAMVARQLSLDYEFICFTDNTEGIHPDVSILPLPELGVAHPKNVPGKWTKTALWQANLFGLEGVALFIDLDTVLVDCIDEFFDYGNPSDVVVTRNWLKPAKKLGQTTLFRYPVGGNPKVYNDFINDPQKIADKYQFEQHYVTAQIENDLKFWPSKWVKHYRIHCLTNNYIRRYLRPATIPKGARIIAFPGIPNPAEAAKGVWNGIEQEHISPTRHLVNSCNPKERKGRPFIKHLKCYQKPCVWIQKHWTENP